MWAWLFSPLGRKVAVGVGLVLALFVALKWYEAKIRADEQAKQADKQSQEIEKMRAADRAQVQEVLNAAQEKQEAAERRMQASLDREAGLVRALASIQQQRTTASDSVQRVRDSELHSYNASALGIRTNTDSPPCYLVAEERAIATALTQYPLCQKQVEAQGAQITEVKEQVAALSDKVTAIEQQRDAISGYADRLSEFYTLLYNSIPRKRRSIKCLGLWRCGNAKPLPTPEPLTIQKLAPRKP